MFNRITTWFNSYKHKRTQRKRELIRSWDEITMGCRDALKELDRLMDFSKYIDQQLKADWDSSALVLMEKIKNTRRYSKLSQANKIIINQFRQSCTNLNDICAKYNVDFIAKEKEYYNSLFANIEGRLG